MGRVQAPKRPAPGQAIRFSGVDWAMYSRLLKAFDEFPGVKITYDRGELEIMSPLPTHDGDARWLGDLVVFMTVVLKIPLRRGGGFTIRRRSRQRGLESDECFWIQNALKMAGPRRFNPRTDPPPDLALEVDVTNSSLNRLAIYAALGIPEVWRLDGDILTFYSLVNRAYQVIPNSVAFPFVTPADLMGFITQARGAAEETTVTLQFFDWVRQRTGTSGGPP